MTDGLDVSNPARLRDTARPFRAVVTDLDGTISDRSGSISPRVQTALRNAARAGALVVLATARPPRWITETERALVATGLVICANGALIFEMPRWRPIYERTLSAEESSSVVRQIRARLPSASFAVEYPDGHGREPAFTGSRAPESGGVIADALELARRPTTKILVHDPDLETEHLLEVAHRVIGVALETTQSGVPRMIEIGPYGVTKAGAIARVCADRGIASGEVIAFGDMPNDAGMLKWAGWGVAVANAHRDVIEVADEVTAAVEDDGVALVLERHFPPRGLERGVA